MSSANLSCECGTAIKPVFGNVWPAECTRCASSVLVSKDGYEAAMDILEQHNMMLLELVVEAWKHPAASFRVDGLVTKQRFKLLDGLKQGLGDRRTMKKIAAAQRIGEQRATSGKTTNVVERKKLGYRWDNVSPEKAIELRKTGFEVRYIGVAWQVKIS